MSGKAGSFKIELPDKTKISQGCWDSGNKEAFLIHVMGALSIIERKNLFKDFETAKVLFNAAQVEVNHAQIVFEELVGQKATSKQKAEAQDDLDVKKAQAEQFRAEMAQLAVEMFSIYENLLSKNARVKWHKIVSEQTGAAPWTDLNGKSHTTAREKDMTAFEDCVTFHLLTVFSEDSAEQQRYYINMSLKKPGKVTIRDFVERIEQLNSYLGRLPGLIDSPKKTKKTKAVEPLMSPNWPN